MGSSGINTHFPWGATATGSAHAMITVTLPLGLDGSKFRMHLQTLNGQQLGLGSGKSPSAVTTAGQVYVHRARNNNGRTFEVTQAYENKVAGATTFSKVNGVTQEATILGTGFGSLVATDGSGVDATKYIPGTYYNVRLLTDATHDSSGTGRGVFVKVVVGVGAIKHVEVTAGGIGVVPGEKLVIGCDTRIHPDFNDCDGTADVAKHARVTFGAASEVLATNNVLGIGMRVGAVASLLLMVPVVVPLLHFALSVQQVLVSTQQQMQQEHKKFLVRNLALSVLPVPVLLLVLLPLLQLLIQE